MKLLTGYGVRILKGETARTLSQRAVLPAKKVLPEFSDSYQPDTVRRLSSLLYGTLGEPSFVSEKPVDGPVYIWVVALKNNNGIISFELWLNAPVPRNHVFVDRDSPVIAVILRRLKREIAYPVCLVQH